MNSRLGASYEALEQWATSRELVEMLEQAVHADELPTEASAALTAAERFRNAKRQA